MQQVSIRRFATLLMVARTMVEDQRTEDFGEISKPVSKKDVAAFFADVNEQITDRQFLALTDGVGKSDGSGALETELASPLSIEEQQMVLLIASALHDEVNRSVWLIRERSLRRSDQLHRIAAKLKPAAKRQPDAFLETLFGLQSSQPDGKPPRRKRKP